MEHDDDTPFIEPAKNTKLLVEILSWFAVWRTVKRFMVMKWGRKNEINSHCEELISTREFSDLQIKLKKIHSRFGYFSSSRCSPHDAEFSHKVLNSTLNVWINFVFTRICFHRVYDPRLFFCLCIGEGLELILLYLLSCLELIRRSFTYNSMNRFWSFSSSFSSTEMEIYSRSITLNLCAVGYFN